jgi:hypothetical protein
MTTVPVLAVTGSDADYPDGLAFQFEGDLYIPTMFTLDRDMTILAADDMNADPGEYFE